MPIGIFKRSGRLCCYSADMAFPASNMGPDMRCALQITAADIPTSPSAATCKANLDAAAAAFTAASNAISGVKQIAGATPTNYVRHLCPSQHIASAYLHMTTCTCSLPPAQQCASADKGMLLKKPMGTMHILRCFLSRSELP